MKERRDYIFLSVFSEGRRLYL